MFYVCNRVLDHVANFIIAEESGLSTLYVQKVEKSGWVVSPCGYWIKSSMTVLVGMTDARPLPLWIADQVQYDGSECASMKSARPLPLWIAGQVRNDAASWPARLCPVSPVD